MSEQSVKWLKTVAEHGDVKAQYELGVLYEYGIDVTKDSKESLKWYRKAAMQGHAEAQIELDIIARIDQRSI